MQSIICERCGQAAVCPDSTTCAECRELRAVIAVEPGNYCHACLFRDVRRSIQAWLDAHPQGVRVPEVWQARPLREGVDYYLERGNWVFTEWYHRKRGRCCGSGCRHCPWRVAVQSS